MPFLLIDSLPREKASIGSKKRKLLPSKISMELAKNNRQLLPEATSTRPTHGPTLNPTSILNTTRQLYPKSATSYPKDTMPYPKGPTSYPKDTMPYPKGQHTTYRELHQAQSGLPT